MDIYAVQERPGDALAVIDDGAVRAGTRLDWVPRKTTRAWIHCSKEHEIGREGQCATGPADGDNFVLKWLAQHFKDALAELRQFIEEQDTAMRQRNFTWMRYVPPAHQSGMADGVMRRSERPLLD